MMTKQFQTIKISCFFTFLSFLSSQLALAQSTPAAGGPTSFLINIVPLLLLGLLFYFGILQPQRKQQKAHQEFLLKLNKGDEVVTQSGIIGKITGLSEKVVTLEVDPGTEIRVLRSQIQSLFKDAVQTATKS